ncbi:MAG: cytochrome P450 [Granulosicoccus sp.]
MSNSIRTKNSITQDPRDESFVQNPYRLYSQLHQTGKPVFWEDYGFWCLSGFASVNQVLRDRRFARLPPAGYEKPPLPAHLKDFAEAEKYSLLALEPPAHTRLRKLVNGAFVSRQVDQMADDIANIANHCIDRFAHDGTVELLEHYATTIPVVVISKLLGVPESAGKQLLAWSHAMVRVYTLTQTRAEEIEANTAAIEFQAYLRKLISRKRLAPDGNLISHLLTQEDDEKPLSEEEIISVVILLLNAGHEATVHQLGNTIATLLNHYPDNHRATLLDLLATDQGANALVAESLRFAAPLHLFTRYAQEDLELEGGVSLAAGEQIGLLLAAANRCPIRFQESNRFNPDRTDGASLSLGAGIHFCVGAQLAKLELRIALQVLFKRLPDLRLCADARYQNIYHFHGLETLWVSW